MSMNQNTENITIPGIYFGPRDETFKRIILTLLNKGKIKKKYINMLITPINMEKYAAAFTSELVDEENNYQVYEQLGDLVGNQFIVWYIYRRFPQLQCAEGVKVAARLRINYGSKQSFYKFAEELGLWSFITATNDLRYRKKKDLLEDVFEAFIGVTALILDEEIRIGVGNAIVYQILKTIFDGINISLLYKDLYDAKTRLKELFDIHEEILGPLKYEMKRDEKIVTSYVFRLEGGKYFTSHNGKIDKKRIVGGTAILIGTGTASLESDAQQKAAEQGVETMKNQGYYKIPPKCYRKFMNTEVLNEPCITSDYIKFKYNGSINNLFKTKEKSKYQCKYESTVLAMYCRKRDIIGVKTVIDMGCDVNIADSDSMYPMDLLLIGKIEESKVCDIMKLLVKPNKKIKVNKVVIDNYYNKYTSEFIMNIKKYFDIID